MNASTLDGDARIGVLEHRVESLETTVTGGFRDLATRFDKLSGNFAARPVSPPFKEIITSIGATLAVVMVVAGIIGGYVDRTIALAQSEGAAQRRIMSYRIEQIERQINVRVSVPTSAPATH